jgi:hypothetical protein
MMTIRRWTQSALAFSSEANTGSLQDPSKCSDSSSIPIQLESMRLQAIVETGARLTLIS